MGSQYADHAIACQFPYSSTIRGAQTLVALQVRLLHEVRDTRRHVVDEIDGLDSALDRNIFAAQRVRYGGEIGREE